MKMKMFYCLFALLSISILLPTIISDSVCDLNTLLLELKQDLKDNGMLDCLRVIEPPHSVEENEEQKNLRIAAQWDTSCSFESNGAWEEIFKKNYQVETLVDSVGEPLGGIPNFTVIPVDPNQDPDFMMNPFSNPDNQVNTFTQSKLIKDLLKYSPDQLDNKEGELVNIIDKAINSSLNENQIIDKKIDKEKSKSTHIHIKRLDQYSIFNTEGKYVNPDQASIKFKIDQSKLIFGFYLISYKLEKPGEIFFKMNFNNREIAETRLALGNIRKYTNSGAFGEVFFPDAKSEDPTLKINYISNTPGLINSDTDDYNFSFGAITLPPGSVYKRYNSDKLEIAKSEEFSTITDFKLNIKNDTPKPKLYLVMYTMSFLIDCNVIFKSRLLVNKKSIKETNSYMGQIAEVGVHNGRVMTLPPGDNKIEVEYKYSGESISLTDITNNKFVQSIYAFSFPSNTVVHNFGLEKPLVLNTNKDWKSMGIDGKFSIPDTKTALIIYHVNIKTEGKLFKARVRINAQFNKKSMIVTQGLDYAYAQAYVVKVLKSGSYTIDLEYNSKSGLTFVPELREANNESIFVQVILLN